MAVGLNCDFGDWRDGQDGGGDARGEGTGSEAGDLGCLYVE